MSSATCDACDAIHAIARGRSTGIHRPDAPRRLLCTALQNSGEFLGLVPLREPPATVRTRPARTPFRPRNLVSCGARASTGRPRGGTEGVDFLRLERAPAPRSERAQEDRADAHTSQPPHGVSDRLHHPDDLILAP